MLSAYLDGELTDAERVAVDAQLEASAEWRDELAEVARRTRRPARAVPNARRRPASGTRCTRASRPTTNADAADRERRRRRSPRRGPPRRRWGWVAASAAAVAAVVAVIVVPAPQRGVAERGRGRRAARRAGVRQRRSGEHACTRRSARRVPPVTGLRRPSTIALCALADASRWRGRSRRRPARATRPTPRRRRASCAARATPRPITTSAVTPPSPGPRRRGPRRRRCAVTDVGGAVTITTTGGTTVVDEGRRTYLRDRLGWTGLVVEPTARRPARPRPPLAALDRREPHGGGPPGHRRAGHPPRRETRPAPGRRRRHRPAARPRGARPEWAGRALGAVLEHRGRGARRAHDVAARERHAAAPRRSSRRCPTGTERRARPRGSNW